jgi:cellulose synthase/poly-beta-1,6-N-acetylglucosamine synthase-like glycosyltransferase
MPELFFGDFAINNNFLSRISEIFYQKKLIDIKDFDNLEDFFRYLYWKSGEKISKTFLSTICNVEFLNEDEYKIFLNEKFEVNNWNCETLQRNLFLIYQEDQNCLKIFIDFLSDEILDFIKSNFSEKFLKIDFVLCEKSFLINKICEIFYNQLVDKSINNSNFEESAKSLNFLNRNVILKSIFLISGFIFLSIWSAFFIFIFIIFVNLSYSISILYKIFLSFDEKGIEKIDQSDFNNAQKYPIYTILLPVYKEEEKTIKQLVSAVESFDYPQHKLDVKILIEEDDKSIDFSVLNLKYNFDLLYIKNSQPKTKAKACNFAINFARGEFLVIYDSDDIPDFQQLKVALRNFKTNKDATCLQATLNSYNYDENLLTRFYSAEFDLWYKVFLPRMNALNFPTTLGGTSNHFRIQTLKKNLWDAWNVTEDGDLGVRWFLKNLGEVKIIDSQTLEEAPISVKAWINQRSRWIKGFLQTYFVHRKNKNRKFSLWLNLFILLPIASNLLFIPMIFEFFVLKFYHQNIHLLSVISKISLYLFLINYFLQLAPIFLNWRKFLWRPNLKILFFPLYSIILNIPASYKALFQLIFKPFFWEKTTHGLSKLKK